MDCSLEKLGYKLIFMFEIGEGRIDKIAAKTFERE